MVRETPFGSLSNCSKDKIHDPYFKAVGSVAALPHS